MYQSINNNRLAETKLSVKTIREKIGFFLCFKKNTEMN